MNQLPICLIISALTAAGYSIGRLSMATAALLSITLFTVTGRPFPILWRGLNKSLCTF